MTIQQLIQYGIKQLADSPTPRLDVEILLMQLLHCTQAILRAYPKREVTEELIAQFEAVLVRRAAGEPIAYITGEQQFWNFSVAVSRDVLIPRADTEILVEQAVTKIKSSKGHNKRQILDLGTGSGIVAIALALEFPTACVQAVDCSLAALNIARKNAAKNNASNISFYHGNWFEPLQQMQASFNCIVSNPPYIAIDDLHLQAKELSFEPQDALISGPRGLDALIIIINQGHIFLKPGGWLLVEHGYNQEEQVAELFKDNNYSNISSYKDLSGHIRVTGGCKL